MKRNKKTPHTPKSRENKKLEHSMDEIREEFSESLARIRNTKRKTTLKVNCGIRVNANRKKRSNILINIHPERVN